ncbi:MAG: dihydropteroate synthase [Planctomycetaceae bacterium]|nr:dihydropteroate synthase [Planctomycetaceae bacterium]
MTSLPSDFDARGKHLLFVTGKLAAKLVHRVVTTAAEQFGFTFDIKVLGISVAALMHAHWVVRKLAVNRTYDAVLFPGWCQGDLNMVEQSVGSPCYLGPKDIQQLNQFLGGKSVDADLSNYNVEILAEINHAPRLSLDQLIKQSDHYVESGANLIDVGCIPGEPWDGVGDAVAALVQRGLRVSIDSFDKDEVCRAVDAGAELVLSCSSQNIDWAVDVDVEWVVIPDDPQDLASMWNTADQLKQAGRKFRVDPILEPVGFGFAASLARYFEVRRQDPDVPILMGIGNVTELSDVDSAGVNFLLAAICEELSINSVLTTEVITWCQQSVREFDLSRQLAHYAIQHSTPPKRLSPQLVMLHDTHSRELGEETLMSLAQDIRDANFRIFVERGDIHIMNRDGYWRGSDPFKLFDQFSVAVSLDASHAFYLGYELAKAMTALQLGKRYTQDESLHWGFLTVPEPKHRSQNG